MSGNGDQANRPKQPQSHWKVGNGTVPHILLADDDMDDCDLFRLALDGICPCAQFTQVHDGESLMRLLRLTGRLPDMLFLDLNMPLKDGLQCLSEIRQDKKLDKLPITVISTSLNHRTMELLRFGGAQHILKPNNFPQLQETVLLALSHILHAYFPV